MSKPLVAIVGRPNVGKSTLFNRIAGKRIAIVEDTAGITRDRIYCEAEWTGVEFALVDTGGILLNEQDPLRVQVTEQAQVALEEADVVLFMVDTSEGVHPLDSDVADIIRASGKPTIVVANKADNTVREQDAVEFYAMGAGDVFAVSSHNGRNIADLLDKMVEMLPDQSTLADYPEDAVRIAIIGRPNVGKSSLINRVLGEKRVIVSDIPGTTRDTIDTVFQKDDNTVVLIDTAGIRKSGKIQGSVEYYTVLRAVRSMERADVAIILLDAGQGLLEGDKRVAGLAHEAGRACVIVVNKWDLRPEEDKKVFADELRLQLPFISYAPIVFCSALTGYGVMDVVDTAIDVTANHSLRISTGELNRIFQGAADEHPYGRKGRDLKIKYATMTEVKPPNIVVFVNDPELVHFSYARYLENKLREVYSYEGTTVRLSFRKAKKTRG